MERGRMKKLKKSNAKIARPKKKQVSLSKLKKKLWDLFSLYIKLKYSVNGSDVNCFTCGRPIKIGTSNCHGGHYYSKKHFSGLYLDENNVRPQCYHCNVNMDGSVQIYRRKLIE